MIQDKLFISVMRKKNEYQGCDQKKYDYEGERMSEGNRQKKKREADYQSIRMKIICCYLIDHLCRVQHISMQHEAHTGAGLISDSGFLLFH